MWSFFRKAKFRDSRIEKISTFLIFIRWYRFSRNVEFFKSSFRENIHFFDIHLMSENFLNVEFCKMNFFRFIQCWIKNGVFLRKIQFLRKYPFFQKKNVKRSILRLSRIILKWFRIVRSNSGSDPGRIV